MAHLFEGAGCTPANANDPVAGQNSSGLGGAARDDPVDDVRGPRGTYRHEESRENQDGEQEVGHWSRKHHQEPLVDRPKVETARPVGGAELALVGGGAGCIFVADETDVAAERQPADLPERAALVGPAGDLSAKA